jgi:hypothetical protein
MALLVGATNGKEAQEKEAQNRLLLKGYNMNAPLSAENDRELLRLLIKEAVQDGFAAHRETDHARLEERLDATRRQVWTGAGIALAVSALLSRLVRG